MYIYICKHTGTYVWPDGATFTGMYNNGQRMAHGVYTFPDGRTFEGGLPRADLICMSGQGTMKYPKDNRIAKGMWDRTKLRMKPDKSKPSVSIDHDCIC